MLKRKTILLMISAIALFGLVALIEGNRSVTNKGQDDIAADANPQQGGGEPLFDFTEEEVETLEVQRSNESLAFEKLADDTWEMIEPEIAEAEGGAIAFLLSQITNPSAHTFTTTTEDLRDFGLQNPEATVTLTANSKTYTLTVGDDDFTGDQLYVRAEPSAEAADDEGIKVHVVSGGMRNAVNRPTQDWLIAEELDEELDTEEASPEEASSEEISPEEASPEEASSEEAQ